MSESQVRPLQWLEDATTRRKVWKTAVEKAGGQPTARDVITRLCEQGNFTPALFQTAFADAMAGGGEKLKRLDATLDKLRPRYGRSVVYFGGVHDARDNAPMRINFTHIPGVNVES